MDTIKAGSRRRALTVRDFDLGARRVTADATRHGSGVLTTWTDGLGVGDRVAVAGMRPERHPPRRRARHGADRRRYGAAGGMTDPETAEQIDLSA